MRVKKELYQVISNAYELLSSDLKECISLIHLLGKTQKDAVKELQLSKYSFQVRYIKAIETMRLNFMQIYYGMNTARLID